MTKSMDSIIESQAAVDLVHARSLAARMIPAHRFAEVLSGRGRWSVAEEKSLSLPANQIQLRVWQQSSMARSGTADLPAAASSPPAVDSDKPEPTLNETSSVAATAPDAPSEDPPSRLIAALRDLIKVRPTGGSLEAPLRVALAWIARCFAFDEQQGRGLFVAIEEAIGLPTRSMVFRSSGDNAAPALWSCDQETVLALWNKSASLRLAFGSDSGGEQLAIVELRTDHDDSDVTVAFTHRFNGRVADRFVIRANGPPVVLLLNSGQHEYIVDVTTAGGMTMQHSIKKTV